MASVTSRIEFALHLIISGSILITGLLAAQQVQSLPLGVSKPQPQATAPVYDLPEVVVRVSRR